MEVKKPDLPAVADKPAPGVYVPGKPYTPVKVDTQLRCPEVQRIAMRLSFMEHGLKWLQT